MSKPTMFIGSSKDNLRVAKALSLCLTDEVDITVWDEGIFGLNQGILEELHRKIGDFDFAALVLAPDDMTESKGERKYSPRDNVLFECGLFMGKLGRGRTFIVYDQSKELKIPSDLAGVTLAPYDGNRIEKEPQPAVSGACFKITEAIKKIEFSKLIGDWKSKYPITYQFSDDSLLAEDEIGIKQSRGKLRLIRIKNPLDDNYIANADIVLDKYLIGEWKSISANAQGAFLLTLHPNGNIMYGYFTGPDERGAIIYCPWVLARIGSHEDIDKLLNKGEKILKDSTPMLLNFDSKT